MCCSVGTFIPRDDVGVVLALPCVQLCAARGSGRVRPRVLISSALEVAVSVHAREIYEFSGGSNPLPMSLIWHHLIFDPDTSIGVGEYTYRGRRQYTVWQSCSAPTGASGAGGSISMQTPSTGRPLSATADSTEPEPGLAGCSAEGGDRLRAPICVRPTARRRIGDDRSGRRTPLARCLVTVAG